MLSDTENTAFVFEQVWAVLADGEQTRRQSNTAEAEAASGQVFVGLAVGKSTCRQSDEAEAEAVSGQVGTVTGTGASLEADSESGGQSNTFLCRPDSSTSEVQSESLD